MQKFMTFNEWVQKKLVEAGGPCVGGKDCGVKDLKGSAGGVWGAPETMGKGVEKSKKSRK